MICAMPLPHSGMQGAHDQLWTSSEVPSEGGRHLPDPKGESDDKNSCDSRLGFIDSHFHDRGAGHYSHIAWRSHVGSPRDLIIGMVASKPDHTTS